MISIYQENSKSGKRLLQTSRRQRPRGRSQKNVKRLLHICLKKKPQTEEAGTGITALMARNCKVASAKR
jgi:hypothetical protein